MSSTSFNFFPALVNEKVSLFIPTPFGDGDTPDFRRHASIHYDSDFATAIRPLLTDAIKAATDSWTPDEVAREIEKHVGADKWINFGIGRSQVFEAKYLPTGSTTVPKHTTVKKLLSHNKVRLWHLTGEVEVYEAKIGVYPRGTKLRCDQVVVEYPAPVAYPFAQNAPCF